MEVVVSHTPRDYYAAVRHITRRMFAGSPTRYLVGTFGALYGFFLAISVMLLAQFLERYPGPDRAYVIYALGGVILAFVSGVLGKYAYQALAARVMSRPNGYGSAPQRFAIEDDALVHSMRNSHSRFAWTDIEAVQATKEYVFAFLDRGIALYIARRGFPDDATFDEFCAGLNARVAASRNPAAPRG